MKVDEKAFRKIALKTIRDKRLSGAYATAMQRNRGARAAALERVPDVDELRDELKQIRAATVANLGEHLQEFERNAARAGAQVHWAQGKEDLGNIVLEIARQHNARRVVKSKSMVTEEVHLNQMLEEAGMRVVETDLGEYIIQLAGETPSHIIAPAIHQTAGQVADLFADKIGQRVDSTPSTLTQVARQTLRQIFLEADIGISGVNLGVAETGSIVLVTNEGNGRLTTSLPKVHIAVMGIERLAPTWEEAGVWLSLLARFSTGQALSVYTSVITGPARDTELDGPEEVHIILLDNNRSRITGTKYEEALQCIRCGACLSVCPVYLASGGHAYHSPYSGPIGAVISPLLFGLENYKGLPNASTLCGACLDVCPVRIDLPRMLRELRVDQVEQGLVPLPERVLEQTASRMLATPLWMQVFFGLGRFGQLMMKLFNIKFNQLEQYPMVAQKSFRQQWAAMQEEPDERQG